MTAASTSKPWQKFLSGLLATSLGLLLPVQLLLLWLAVINRPLELPTLVTDHLTQAASKHGLKIQARHFWLLPDHTLAADDLSVEVEGLSGEIFTAERCEVGLSFTALLNGTLEPNRLLLRDGKIWCPAAVAKKGERHELISGMRIDLRREGAWLMAPVLRAHSPKLNIIVSGELPLGLFSVSETHATLLDPKTPEIPLAQRTSNILRNLEEFILVAEHSGGASVNATAQGTSQGGAILSTQVLFGDDWLEDSGALIRVEHLHAKGDLELSPRGTLERWDLRIRGRHLAYKNVQAGRFDLHLHGKQAMPDVEGQLLVAHAAALGLKDFQLKITLPARTPTINHWPLDVTAFTEQSRLHAAVELTSTTQAPKFTLFEAQLATAELQSLESYQDLVRQAGVNLTGQLLVRDAHLNFNPDFSLQEVRGEIGFSGLTAWGVSASSIAPGEDLPLSAKFSYRPQPQTNERPLRLTDLHLGTITGEAYCSLQKGGDYTLHLRGPLAPPSLDTILGDWWVDLWKMFNLKSAPLAVIDVDGQWGKPKSTTTGYVQLQQFNFLNTPFRSVGISVKANGQGTYIGLHRLAGGSEFEDGSVDGSAVWDWSKPAAEAGPIVHLAGNLKPWIAARCAGPELSEALRGLVLPSSQTFTLDVLPGKKNPTIKAQVNCPTEFQAWGIPSQNLSLTINSSDTVMQVDATAALAGGQSELHLQGDPLQTPDLHLRLQGCNPQKIQLIMEQIDSGKNSETATTNQKAVLDLEFKGRVDLKKPRLLRGRGSYLLIDPELKRIRTLGSVSRLLEGIGVNATTYDLQKATGSFGCLDGRVYFPDLTITGKQAKISLQGEVDLMASQLQFEGECSLPSEGGLGILDFFNINRTLFNMTKIKVTGPLNKPETSLDTKLSDIGKSNKGKNLGKIPPSLLE